MNKRILLPTDFSKNALNAIRYALDLYENQRCEFYFLNVFQVNNYRLDNMMVPEPGNPVYEAARASSEKGFEKLMEILGLHHDNSRHTYHTISSFNLLLEALRETIAKKDIDLVIMGTQGATGAKGVIFGSNAVNIMEKITSCPVIAVPEDVRFSPPKEIVFPTDYKTVFKRRELNYLLEIAKLHSSAIRVLHIKKETEFSKAQINNKELLEEILNDVDHSFHALSDIGIQKGITTFIESRGSDMIAFINKKHFFFETVFSKPLVKEIGYAPTRPILALHGS